MARVHEMQGDLDVAIADRKRIIKSLREEYSTTSGEGIELHRRAIERLVQKKEEKR